MAFDLGILVASWLVSAAGVLAWIHRSGQTAVPRSRPHSRMVVVRLAVLYALTYLPVCVWFHGPVVPLAIAFPLLVLLLCTVSLKWLEGADSAGGFAIAILFVAPLYAIRQYLLGFPDRGDLILTPPSTNRCPADRNGQPAGGAAEISGGEGIVVAPLRPSGLVEIAGNRADATSFDGQWIAAGTPVEVCDRRSRTLVVRPVSADKVGKPADPARETTLTERVSAPSSGDSPPVKL